MVAPRSLAGPPSENRYRYDHAQAVPLQVCLLSLQARIMLMSRYQGHVGAYLVLGGVDSTGAHLFTIHAHGSTDKLPYVTMGSGSLAAMAVFESSFKENMKVGSYSTPRTRQERMLMRQREEAIELVARAIRSGVFNDLGSGSNVDVAVITKDKTEMLRNYEMPVSLAVLL